MTSFQLLLLAHKVTATLAFCVLLELARLNLALYMDCAPYTDLALCKAGSGLSLNVTFSKRLFLTTQSKVDLSSHCHITLYYFLHST